MKALRYILCILVILAAVGLLVYEGLVLNNLESSNLVRGGLIIAGALITMLKKPRQRQPVSKKSAYRNAYPEFIQEPFADQPKLEKRFYAAVDDFNGNNPARALEKLKKLRPECRNSQELRSVTVFTALCLDDLKQYREAITLYEAARRIRDCSTLASNMGLDYQRLGQYERAKELYGEAIRLDPNNACAYNNLSALYFFQGHYDSALGAARDALQRKENLPQALSTAAICCKLLGDEANYELYYRRAVAAGYDGDRIKRVIQKLDSQIG